MSAQGETIKLLTEKIVQIRWYMNEYAEFSTPKKNKKAESDISQFTKAIEILKASEGNADNASTEPSINYDGVLGTVILTIEEKQAIHAGISLGINHCSTRVKLFEKLCRLKIKFSKLIKEHYSA